MTPGPVSDSYDPEFGTAANADYVYAVLIRECSAYEDLLGVFSSFEKADQYCTAYLKKWPGADLHIRKCIIDGEGGIKP